MEPADAQAPPSRDQPSPLPAIGAPETTAGGLAAARDTTEAS